MGERSHSAEVAATQKAFYRLDSLFDFSRQERGNSQSLRIRKIKLGDDSVIECWKSPTGLRYLPHTPALVVFVRPFGGSSVTVFSLAEKGLGHIEAPYLDVVVGSKKASAVTANLTLKLTGDGREKDIRRFRNLSTPLVRWIATSIKEKKLTRNPLSFSPNNLLAR